MDDFIKFDSGKHIYTDASNNTYTSVTQLIRLVQNEFPKNVIARNIAKRDGKTVEEVLAEWAVIGKEASDHGTMVHSIIESCLNQEEDAINNKVWPKLYQRLQDIFDIHDHIDTEHRVYSTKCLVAGTLDIRAFRTKKIVDYADAKTNIRKGIEYSNKYGKFLKTPLNHLEDCNFNHVALQLSIYAYLDTFNSAYVPGSLSVLYIKDHMEGEVEQIFVPYMKAEVEQLINHHVEVNKIVPAPKIEIEEFRLLRLNEETFF